MKYLRKVSYILLATSLFLYANTDEEFIKASNDFFAKGKVFQGESTALMNNTHAVDTNIHELSNGLQEVHKTTDSLINLNNDIKMLTLGLAVAGMIPEIKPAAEALLYSLKIIDKPLSTATNTMKKIDSLLSPVLKATQSANQVTTKLIAEENVFRNNAITYLNDVEALSKKCQGKVAIDVLNDSSLAYTQLDANLKKINDAYDVITKAPSDAINKVMKEIDKIKKVVAPVNALSNELKALLTPLNALQVILDNKISLSVPYVCGVKTCQKEASYPCGTKKCKKKVMGKKVHYPCGVKTCQKNVSYPCGSKKCTVNISLSVADILQDMNAVEAKIEKTISGFAFNALKAVGLGNAIKTLKQEAAKLMASAMKALNLNIKVKLPDLGMGINLQALNLSKLESDLQKLELQMKKLTFSSLKKYTCK